MGFEERVLLGRIKILLELISEPVVEHVLGTNNFPYFHPD